MKKDEAVTGAKRIEDTEDVDLKDPEKIRSRKDRPSGSIHFGDTDFDVAEEYGDATWGEVCHT